MPRHTLKLLVLLSAFSVAPATAGHRALAAEAKHHHSACPYERAREEAAARAAAAFVQPVAAPKGPTTITLTDRAPADSSLLGLGRGGFVSP